VKLGTLENLAILMLAGEPIKKRLHRLVDELDESTLLAGCVKRIEMGQAQYGELQKGDPRDFKAERFPELLDAAIYDVFDVVTKL
jgi:hypothetical protein